VELLSVADGDLPTVVRFLLGRVFPAHESRTLDVGPRLGYGGLARAAGPDVGADDVEGRLAEVGEIGDVAASYDLGGQQGLGAFAGGRDPLSVPDIEDRLRELAAAEGPGSQETKRDVLFGLFSRTEPEEARYLARLGLSEMRIGVGEGTVRDAIRALPATDHPYQSALVLHDGLSDIGERLSLAIQRRFGPHVEFAGGAASDNYRMESTPVFCGETVAEDALVLTQVSGTKRPVISVDHGHEPISEPWEVTDADGNVVHELGGEPAFEVWKDAVRDSAAEIFGTSVDDLSPSSDELHMLMGAYEFGIDQGDDYKIRWPRAAVESTGSLEFAVNIPEGTVLRVMYGERAEQIQSARRAADDALARSEGDIAGAFVYDCACREFILQNEFPDAVGEMADGLAAPFAGFETYGELCMQRGHLSGFHNTTTVIFALPE
jgi:methyl-accepting chemotaxis protein